MKQYRKGLTAVVVDRCVVYTYPTIGTTVCSEKFYLLLFWSRLVHADLAMHATLAALGNGFNVIYCAFPFQQPLREWMTTKIHGARTYGPHLPKARAIAGYSATHASNNEGARVRQCIETTVEIILVTAVV